MSLNFIISQLIGFIAWLIILLSYHRKTTNKILAFHMVAAFLFCIHYYLLDAFSGCVICFFELVRDFLYYKTDKDNHIFLFSIFFYGIGGYFLYKDIFSLFPLLASFLDGFFLTKDKKMVVFGSIITYFLWFGYDIIVKSFSGVFSDIIVILSNILILVFNINIFDKTSNQPVIVKR